MKRLFILLFLVFSFDACFAQNALINEKSPYLLQHAHNPVNWTAWGKQSDNQKLKIISIGYSACHWCHVMEKESFSDVEVAKLMNQHFVNIKIDREERPDIDQIYMTACQLTNEKGCGWPLNVIALPDGKPVWIGSYLPKNKWEETLRYFLNIQKTQSEKLKQYAQHLKEGIEEAQKFVKTTEKTPIDLKKLVANIEADIDFEDGGLIGTPKFPTPNLFNFLLKYEHANPNQKLKNGIANTLNRMASGGIYDHLGGGFARYSTDDEWIVPHFEKMLYDNAQLVSLYARASKQSPRYQQIVRETITFLEQNLQDKSGGFYASLDADSEGQEGKYYTWTKAEINQILGKEADDFFKIFDLKKGILLKRWNADDAGFQPPIFADNKSVTISVAKHQRHLRSIKNFRQKRPKPATDTKIITSWNALMIQAYLDAYRFLGDDEYLKKAQKLANYLLKNHFSKSNLKRLNYGNTQGFLEDYAYLADALLNLYQATFELKYLQQANILTTQVFKNFKQNEQGLFYYSQSNQLFTNSIEVADGVLPSANAVFAHILFNLGLIFEDNNYSQTAQQMTQAMQQKISTAEHANAYYQWGNVLMQQQKPPLEVAIVGKNAKQVAKHFQQFDNIILMGATDNEPLPLLKDKLQKGKTMIYVCQNHVCKIPTEDVKKAIAFLKYEN